MPCCLCFEESYLVYKIKECFFAKENSIELIGKYFEFLVLDEDSTICNKCWKQIQSWHEFYDKIFKVQKTRFENNKISLNVDTNIFPKLEESPTTNEIKLEGSCVDADGNFLDADVSNINQTEHDDYILNSNSYSENSNLLKNEENKTENPLKTITNAINPSIPLHVLKTLEPEDLIKKNEIEDEIDKKLNQHIKYKCNFCEEMLPSFKKLVRHIFNIHKRKGYALCCNIKLFNRTLAIEHIDRYHSKMEVLHKCPECPRQFFNVKTLNNHRVSKHNFNKKHLFPCKLCINITFSRVDQLKKHHKEVHTEKEYYKCTKCTKIFEEKNKLRDHFLRVHSLSVTEYICDICGLSFKTKCGFKNHHKEVHLGLLKPKEKCDICGNLVKSLKKHKYMTHPPNDVIIKCDICDKKISTWNALYNHKQHAHGEKKFICEICRKAFKELKLLKEHIATHTGQPLYQCAYCSTTFKCEANYFKHRKRIHQEEMQRDDKRSKINLN